MPTKTRKKKNFAVKTQMLLSLFCPRMYDGQYDQAARFKQVLEHKHNMGKHEDIGWKKSTPSLNILVKWLHKCMQKVK